MIKYESNGPAVILLPETVKDCGLMQWLAKRFYNQTVTLEFDTTYINGQFEHPALWIKPVRSQKLDLK